DRREEEARRVASRLKHLLENGSVVDPDDDTTRGCRAGDIAILARRNDDLAALEPALRSYAVPFFNTATSGLAEGQEVLDLVTALRLIDDRYDDLRAFAFLRSPFVGLRDEVLVRISLRATDGARSLLDKAASFLDDAEAGRESWFEAPESARIGEIERAALRDGLGAMAEAQRLADRVDHAEVLETLLTRTGYRLHLLIREGASESLANIERFRALLDEYRHLTLGRFLALWDRWGDRDLGIPQARLFSSGDDVVTLSTIHAAKGLEWPIVALVGTQAPLAEARRFVGTHWTDPTLGPVLLPRAAERGPRATFALERRLEQENAEEARLLYVAATRARDRLVVAAPADEDLTGFAGWLAPELESAREVHQTSDATADDPEPERASLHATDDDERTGTGGQLDAFGLDGERRNQLDLFTPGSPPVNGTDPADGFVIIRRGGGSFQTSFGPPPVTLRWLDGLDPCEWPDSVGDIAERTRRIVGSATERMMRDADPEAWARRYLHGVLDPDDFLPPAGDRLPAKTRGTLIHGVLERIAAAEELDRVLDETIASLDLADLESALAPGASYRAALEREIADVVRSPAWRWYVEGEHYRELRFLHRSENEWLQGAFDLYRPARGVAPEQASLFGEPREGDDGRAAWVIDFKTHRIAAEEVEAVSADYALQIRAYRDAAAALGDGAGVPPRVALHFTKPNLATEV
ncbi:MAG: PD-(D/E)XK nuclease family protein, partial [Gemmatimonadetes bacterium]|nr:PD-(D/E)XK nuclease family protein [Gemmatimonadota bacterium]